MIKKFLMGAALVLAVACVAQAADFSKIPDASKNMKVGQWVKYSIMGGTEQVQKVTAIEGSGDERVITLSIETSMGGNVVSKDEQQVNLRESKEAETKAREENPDIEITEEKVTVGGKSFDAIVLTANIQGTTTKTYMSHDVPVTGLLKMEIAGLGTMMELVDFGE